MKHSVGLIICVVNEREQAYELSINCDGLLRVVLDGDNPSGQLTSVASEQLDLARPGAVGAHDAQLVTVGSLKLTQRGVISSTFYCS